MKGPRICVGQVFGRWLVLRRGPDHFTPRGKPRVRWTCRCECGNSSDVLASSLRRGASRSCGCLQREIATQMKLKHGESNTLFYDMWVHIKQRCQNPDNVSFRHYGARGITVCDRWLDYTAFKADMEPSYQPGLTIDRIDNDGPYSPENCRWATAEVQMRNQRKTVRVRWDGKQVPLADLADKHGVDRMIAWSRLKVLGWTAAQAVGIDPPPSKIRPPVAESTRERMRQAAIDRWRRNRESCDLGSAV